MNDNSIEHVVAQLRKYTKERDWGQFHSPKNLSMALSVEAAELLEIFQWMTEKDSLSPPPKMMNAISDELADIFVYTLMVADKLDIDLMSATLSKIEKNKAKYPADKVRGKSQKYTEY